MHPQLTPNIEVRVFSVQDRRNSKGYANRPWLVRWEVDRKRFSRSHRTRSEADHYRSELFVAKRNGELFDPENGEPASWAIEPDVDPTVVEWVRRWLQEQWDEWQPRTRDSALEAVSRFVPLAVKEGAPKQPRMRTYLKVALRPDTQDPVDAAMEKWLERWSVRLSQLNRAFLAKVDNDLGLKLDGTPGSAGTASKYRTVCRACISRAVDLELLEHDPWPPVVRGAKNRKVRKKVKKVDADLLPDPVTMQQILDAIVTHQPASLRYHVMTSIMYYAGLRPSEVVMLRPKALTLPDAGWGQIHVTEADISFDEPGDPKTGPRKVPIPANLVKLLADWNETNDLTGSDLLFRTRNRNQPSHSNWTRAFKRALKTVDHHPIRLYDCRHTAATTWLAAGVPLGETARRLGHSVEVLVTTYVGALTGDETAANTMIDDYFQRSGRLVVGD